MLDSPSRRRGEEAETTVPPRIWLAIATVLLLDTTAPGADDCLLDWVVAGSVADRAGRTATCRDGTPACDADGVTDGTCTFAARLCLNAAACAAPPAGRVRVRGKAGVLVAGAVRELAAPAGGAACTHDAPVQVALGRHVRRRLAVRASVRDPTSGRTDRDRLRLVCERGARAGTGGRAVVVTTNFETGLLVAVGAAAPHGVRRVDTRINADAVVRSAGDRVYVVNRFLGDNLQVLDPTRGFATVLQCTTGAGSNPHDVAVVDAHKAYVTRYGRAQLWVVDPGAAECGGFHRGSIDLSAYADPDGIPEMAQMALVGGRLFVTLERLDRGQRFAPAGRAALAVIDTTTDTVTGTVELSGANAFSDASGIGREPGTGKLLVAEVGRFFHSGDGGIERVDPFTLTAEGFLVTEDALGGDVTDFLVLSPTKGYAVVLLAENPPRNALVAFDPSHGTLTRRLLVRPALPDIALAPDGSLWVADASVPGPGLRFFDPADDRPLTTGVLDVGLPPFAMAFLP